MMRARQIYVEETVQSSRFPVAVIRMNALFFVKVHKKIQSLPLVKDAYLVRDFVETKQTKFYTNHHGLPAHILLVAEVFNTLAGCRGAVKHCWKVPSAAGPHLTTQTSETSEL